MPLCYRRVAGTMADVPAVRALIRDMGPSLAGEVRLVMDRGFWSAANVSAMMGGHLKFLMGVPTSLGLYADAVDGHGAELRTRGNLDPPTGLYGMRLAHGWDHGEARPRGGDVAGAGRRGHTCLFFDAPRAAEAGRRLAGLLRELASELAAGNRIESHERCYDRYFEVRGGRPVGRDAAIAAATARAGYFALFSNEAMGPFEALAIYRDRDAIERRLGDARSLLGRRAASACRGHARGEAVRGVRRARARRLAAPPHARDGARRRLHPGGPARRGGDHRAVHARRPQAQGAGGHPQAEGRARASGLRSSRHVMSLWESRGFGPSVTCLVDAKGIDAPVDIALHAAHGHPREAPETSLGP